MASGGCLQMHRVSSPWLDDEERRLPGIVGSFRYHVRNVVSVRACLRLSFKLLQYTTLQNLPLALTRVNPTNVYKMRIHNAQYAVSPVPLTVHPQMTLQLSRRPL